MNNIEFEEKFSAMSVWADSIRNELAGLISGKPSEIIFHYTDINGLIGLISSGCVWATHTSRLNDSSENEHGFNLVKDYVLKNLKATSRVLIEKVISEIQNVDTYVACYSTESDLLGQWRSYTGDKAGYSLGFETKYMATLDDRMPLLEQVIYNDCKAKELLDLLLLRVDEFINKQPFGEVEIGYILGMVRATLAIIACITKHHKFEEEREYRQIYQPGRTNLKLAQGIRKGQFGLTPYVEVEFVEKGKLPIKSITIGPCQDFKLESNALKMLLAKYGYEKVEIVKSVIPLRAK